MGTVADSHLSSMSEKNTDAAMLLNGISDVVDKYDTWLLDQWGVIHNGVSLHDGAHDAMARLKHAGKTIVILSNSGKRVIDSYGRMESLGVPRALFDAIVTSGEMVYRNLIERRDPFYAALGSKARIFAWDSDRGVIEGTGVEEVESIEQAQFILCVGTDHQDLEHYTPELEYALQRHLPLICGNPDRVSVQPDGSLKICPGAVAERYEEMGGVVRWHGKPTREAYYTCQAIAEAMGASGGLGSMVGVGDSLIHDVKGANDFGVASILIAGGIHKDELHYPLAGADVRGLGERYGTVPDYVSPVFTW